MSGMGWYRKLGALALEISCANCAKKFVCDLTQAKMGNKLRTEVTCIGCGQRYSWLFHSSTLEVLPVVELSSHNRNGE